MLSSLLSGSGSGVAPPVSSQSRGPLWLTTIRPASSLAHHDSVLNPFLSVQAFDSGHHADSPSRNRASPDNDPAQVDLPPFAGRSPPVEPDSTCAVDASPSQLAGIPQLGRLSKIILSGVRSGERVWSPFHRVLTHRVASTGRRRGRAAEIKPPLPGVTPRDCVATARVGDLWRSIPDCCR